MKAQSCECDGNGWVSCWQCLGEGGFHDCGEDCCACLEPALNEPCEECQGKGGWACKCSAAYEQEPIRGRLMKESGGRDE